ncbi:pentatricopeptide repeat-containing protein At4g20770-like [Vigna radiata var. radiata]|uniref:Pentatricopeptide repeat-containing protein At4g20770-like n=1 Tax=Vigna radiata var. radiata TaxID=3916 RepID=A0A1S3VBH9_VIGRR|nr:pentatricopeptide repeat-containing protein At4g20770-like [Vigna radiata var. radiata]
MPFEMKLKKNCLSDSEEKEQEHRFIFIAAKGWSSLRFGNFASKGEIWMDKSKSLNLVNLVQLCVTNKDLLAGKVLHARLLRLRLFYDTFLSNHFIELYSKCDEIASAHNVFDNIPHKNIFSWNAILAAYCKTRNLQRACRLFLQMPQRNTVSLNTLISTMVRCGYERQAVDTYDSMMLDGIKPSHITFATVFSACGTLLDVDCGRRNHGFVVKVGLESNIYVVNALLCMYAKCRLIVRGVNLTHGSRASPNPLLKKSYFKKPLE